MVAYGLFFFAIGLFAHGVVEIATRGFYALHDTRTPVGLAAAITAAVKKRAGAALRCLPSSSAMRKRLAIMAERRTGALPPVSNV